MDSSISEIFIEYLDNLKIRNSEQISLRYGEITFALNKQFRETDSKIDYAVHIYILINTIRNLFRKQ